MVFVNTKREAERVADYLNANGVHASAMSGDVPQRKRQRMLKDFQTGDLAVLVGTDVASRGLHIPDVEYVVNYDLPQDAEDYVHRIGRTARAGAAGNAVSFGCENYVVTLPEIEAFIGMKLPVAAVDPGLLAEPVIKPPRRPRRTDGRRGGPPRRSDNGAGRRTGTGQGPRHRGGRPGRKPAGPPAGD
jgi:ATP-dependent RNA helicase RhlB